MELLEIGKMMRLFDLSNKTALVTGASSGLGERFARVLSQAGANVILTARRIDKLEFITSSIKNAQCIQMDVSKKESVASVFQHLENTKQKIDICINNAGVALATPLFETDEQSNFEHIMQTNVMGVWYVTKAVATHMKNHKIEGSIINIGSINGDAIPAIYGAAYSISKAAVIHLTKTLVGELAQNKIRINCVSPGWFRTPMNNKEIDRVKPYIPHGDIGEPDNLDGLILYLASNKASSYVQGSNFTIDGGISWGGEVSNFPQ